VDPKRSTTLAAAKAARRDDARPDAADRVHATGKLTARERIRALLDPGTEVEYGSIAAVDEDGNWVPEAGGIDYVGTIGGQTVIASSTDYTDKGGGYGAGRLERLFALAQEHRWPVVFFVDGGGSRARHPRSGLGHLELNGPYGRFDGMAELSGWVPTVAIVSGPSFAGHASLAGFSDFVIGTSGSSVGMGGPPMVEAALGMRLSPNELAGVEMHELTGGIDLLVPDEPAAIAAARAYLAFQRDDEVGERPVAPATAPAAQSSAPPQGAPPGASAAGIAGAAPASAPAASATVTGAAPATATARHASPDAPHITHLVTEEGPYDMAPVIGALVDDGSFFELRPAFARSVITGFARMGGRSVGVLASQPLVAGGAIDEAAATKVGRFVELCDAYDFPLVVLIDSDGCVTTWPDGEGGSTVEPGVGRWHTRPIVAHQHRSVPLFSVQLRRGRGMAPLVLAGPPNARSVPVLSVAWPTVELGRVDGFSATRNANAFDDVIDPAETRHRIIRLLAHLPRPDRRTRTAKKHPVDTW
jgi:acetyl-CoA carboxylase carboxyltransferase component